jgi:hypothetical protein
MAILKNWDELTEDQIEAIESFRPPKYYIWFYKFYKKFLAYFFFFGIIGSGILMLLSNSLNIDIFNIIKGIFFTLFGAMLWSLSAYLVKHFYTKKYSKSIGLTLENWNYLTVGMTFDA